MPADGRAAHRLVELGEFVALGFQQQQMMPIANLSPWASSSSR